MVVVDNTNLVVGGGCDVDVLEYAEEIVGNWSPEPKDDADEAEPELTPEQRAADRKFVLEQEKRRVMLLQRSSQKKLLEDQEELDKENVGVHRGASKVWRPKRRESGSSSKAEEMACKDEDGTEVIYETLTDAMRVVEGSSQFGEPEMTEETDEGNPEFRGWLIKQGGGSGTFSRKNWKRRWFAINEEGILYHKCPGAEAIGAISFTDMLDLETKVLSGQPAFTIATAARTYFCISGSMKEAQFWISCIKKAKRNYSEARGGTHHIEDLLY